MTERSIYLKENSGTRSKHWTWGVLLKKVSLKVSQNSNTCNRVSFSIKFFDVNFMKFQEQLCCRTPATNLTASKRCSLRKTITVIVKMCIISFAAFKK